MYTALIILHAITCLLLILFVLLQSSRGAGLASVFQAEGGDSFMGAGTGAFLKKITSVLAVIFMVTASSLAYLSVKKQRSVMAPGSATATSPQNAALQQELMKKIKEMAEQKQAQQNGTGQTAATVPQGDPAKAPTVDDVMKETEAFSTAVPKTEKAPATAVPASAPEQTPASAAQAVVPVQAPAAPVAEQTKNQ